MIERIWTAAIYEWLDGSNIQNSDLIYLFLAKQYVTANAFACLLEKFECESELEISNGSLNSLTLNLAESLLDKVTSAGSITRTSSDSDIPPIRIRHVSLYKLYTIPSHVQLLIQALFSATAGVTLQSGVGPWFPPVPARSLPVPARFPLQYHRLPTDQSALSLQSPNCIQECLHSTTSDLTCASMRNPLQLF